MSTNVTVAGQTYSVPAYNEQPVVWGQGANSVDKLLIALAANIASSPTFMQVVNVTSTPTAVVSGKTYLVDSTSLAITLQLPTPAANFFFIVKDFGFNCFTNNITIARFAAEKIDNVAANFTMTNSGSAWIFLSDGTNWFSAGSSGDLILNDIADGNRYRILTNSSVISSQKV